MPSRLFVLASWRPGAFPSPRFPRLSRLLGHPRAESATSTPHLSAPVCRLHPFGRKCGRVVLESADNPQMRCSFVCPHPFARKCARTTMCCAPMSLAHGRPFSNASVRESRAHHLSPWMCFECLFACKCVKIVARQEGNRRLPLRCLFACKCARRAHSRAHSRTRAARAPASVFVPVTAGSLLRRTPLFGPVTNACGVCNGWRLRAIELPALVIVALVQEM